MSETPSHPLTAAAALADTSAPDESAILGQVLGDRACVACGFNLHGQPVVRDPHYGLVMARCPECGVPASLQEHPALGRWAGRLGLVLGAAWLVVMIAALLAPAGAMALVAVASSNPACRSMRLAVADDFMAYLRAQHATMAPEEFDAAFPYFAGWVDLNASDLPYVEEAWWAEQNVDALVAFRGLGSYDWRATAGWIVACVMLGAAGVVLAVMLPHLRVRGQAVAALLIGGVAALLLLVARQMNMLSMIGLNWAGWGVVDVLEVVRERYGLPWQLLTLAVQTLALLAGMWAGRPAARWLAVLLVPPRARAALGFLWATDGLAQPRARAPQVRAR